ncbi:unnamed protein product (macronuclear) [Paramecium tetraurelia]|uniref:Uncharacterized protein n=1 Tax=Paramecium tetraurelia TaxID=5888 RepID=A0CP38_PARTE|nr:uncharacterized protein GSPATT00008946001 [Paramecium tetraurelia]CAK72555.1 unnamed protein product [Paramecium tetraurelia]|eukprot:XP_001439952.1 hypothetical protein (macronuclear) [Paramecium tetraurelia strain d4-2]
MMSKEERNQNQNQPFLTFGDYEKVKFTFSGLDKYIVMELNTKIALEDLKFTFANILKTDFFAKKLEYHVTKGFQDKTLSAQKSLAHQEIQSLFRGPGQQLNIQVKFIEEGA